MTKPQLQRSIGPNVSSVIPPILVDFSTQPGRERELITVLAEMVRLAKAANQV